MSLDLLCTYKCACR